MRKVVVTGSLSFDHIMNLPSRFRDYIMPDKIHMLNVSFYARKMRRERGGTAGNISYTLGLLGQKPHLVAAAGSDFADYKKFLEANGVDCKEVRVFKSNLCSTGFCLTDQDDNQMWGFSGGAMDYNKLLSLGKFKLQKPFVVVSPSGTEGLSNFVSQCIKYKFDYMYDPAFYIPTLPETELKKGVTNCSILIGNDYEISLLKRRLELSMKDLLGKGRVVITTLGAKGSLIRQGRAVFRIPAARSRNTSDPTGAGDAYRAGFLTGYLRGLALDVCGKMGAVAAVYTVEKYGTTTHKFTRTEFRVRYKRNFGEDLNFYEKA